MHVSALEALGNEIAQVDAFDTLMAGRVRIGKEMEGERLINKCFLEQVVLLYERRHLGLGQGEPVPLSVGSFGRRTKMVRVGFCER